MADEGGQNFGWGIVGSGAIAAQFAADLAHVPGAHVAAVFSRGADRAEAFRARIGASRAHATLKALLADDGVAAVYIATPNHLHAEQALACVAAGRPVLVEKPLALTASDVTALEAAARARGVFAMEAMWSRFLPAVQAMKRLIDDGAIGEVTGIRAELAYRHEEVAGSRFFEKPGGGAAYDLGVYPLSLAIFLLGTPDRISGRWTAAASGVDLRTEFQLDWSRAGATLACGFDREGGNAFIVEGTGGALRLDAPFLKAQRVTIHSPAARSAYASLDGAARGVLAKILDRLPIRGRRVHRFPFPGGGLQFEAAAVMEAVRAGRTASEVMPLSQSAGVLDCIETVLAKRPS